MADLPESTEWTEGIYQLETSDPVLGGPEGIDNLQGKQLANRTKWLKDQIAKIIDGTASAGKAIQLKTARTLTFKGAATGAGTYDGSADTEVTLALTDMSWNKIASDKPTTLNGYGITDTYTSDEIDSMIAQASALPVGATVAFPVNKVAPGFLELDGSVKSIAAYPDLSEFLGAAFNRGDEGAGNFRLPESRGEFLRGWDHGRGVDAGRAIGSAQLDALQNITGSFSVRQTDQVAADIGGLGGAYKYGPDGVSGGIKEISTAIKPLNTIQFDASQVVRTASETRPRNLAVMWCIKAWNAPINQGNIDIAPLQALAAQATEINQGTAKIATQAQANAGADDTTIVTPKKLRFGVLSSFGQNGYLFLPSWLGGLGIQWGFGVTSTTTTTHSFVIAFPNEVYQAYISDRGLIEMESIAIEVASLSQYRARSSSGTPGFAYFVIGR